MSDRRLREDVEVHSFLDPDLEVVLKAREFSLIPRSGYRATSEKVSASAGPVTY